MRDLNLGLNDPANAITKQDANVAGGYVGLNSNKQMDASLIPLDYRKSQGYIFDGIDDYLTIPHNDRLNFGADDFSVQCNFTISPSSNAVFVCAKFRSGFAGFIIAKGSNNGLFFRVYGDNTVPYQVNIKTITSTDTKVNLFCIREKSILKVYSDGLLVGTTLIPEAVAPDNNGKFYIGASGSADFHNGTISLVRLFNRALSQSDVTYYENGGRPDLQRLKYEDVITNYGELIPNGFSSSVGWYNPYNVLFEDNKAKFVNKTNANYISKQIVAPLKRYRYKVRVESINIGTSLNIGALGATFTDVGIKVGETVGQTINPHFAISILGAGSLNAILDSISVVQVGCVLELLPENAHISQWLDSTNGLNATTFGNPKINMDSPSTTSQLIDTFNVDIAVGKFNRDLTLPSGWQITDIVVKSSTPLLNVQCQLDGVSLFNNKSVNGIKSFTISESSVYNTGKIIRFNAAGNGGDGMTIIVNIKKI